MALIKNLPFLECGKTIILDEGVEVMYAETLLAGWLSIWKEKHVNRLVEILLFSGPEHTYKNKHEPFSKLTDLKLHDYYTIDVNDMKIDDPKKLHRIINENVVQASSTVIIDCLSSLILYAGVAEAFRFVEKLGRHVAQLICIYRRDFGVIEIPRIETLGTAYVRLELPVVTKLTNNFCYEVSITYRKPGGGVVHQKELVEQNETTYKIDSEKITSNKNRKCDSVNTTNTKDIDKIEASFRLQKNEREIEQKKNTLLPYTVRLTPNASKILYQPDATDDLDEEDPDDDLDF